MQNIIILIIVAVSALFIGLRLYKNLKKSGNGSSCGCGCTQCGPDIASSCRTKSTDD